VYGVIFAIIARATSIDVETQQVAATLLLFGTAIGSFGAIVLVVRRKCISERLAYVIMWVGFFTICVAGMTILNQVAGHGV
jgi:hypothetical protein